MALVCKDLDWSNSLVFPTAVVPPAECAFVFQPVAMPGPLIYNNLPVTYFGTGNHETTELKNSKAGQAFRMPTPKKPALSNLKTVKNFVNKSKFKKTAKNIRNCTPLNLSHRATEKRSRSDSDSELSLSDSDCFISPPKRVKRQMLYIHQKEMRSFFEILSNNHNILQSHEKCTVCQLIFLQVIQLCTTSLRLMRVGEFLIKYEYAFTMM